MSDQPGQGDQPVEKMTLHWVNGEFVEERDYDDWCAEENDRIAQKLKDYYALFDLAPSDAAVFFRSQTPRDKDSLFYLIMQRFGDMLAGMDGRYDVTLTVVDREMKAAEEKEAAANRAQETK